ncbi:MAG: hypothetical protein JO250_01500 [Armatimonadetes bacterium]|nr:hypothetical protein [Armatimonadota bacterium]
MRYNAWQTASRGGRFDAMADNYLRAFRQWFDESGTILSQSNVRVTALRQFQDDRDSIAHAELETAACLGDVSLWEYEDGCALIDTDFVCLADEQFHPVHHELRSPQELGPVLEGLIARMSASPKPQSL